MLQYCYFPATLKICNTGSPVTRSYLFWRSGLKTPSLHLPAESTLLMPWSLIQWPRLRFLLSTSAAAALAVLSSVSLEACETSALGPVFTWSPRLFSRKITFGSFLSWRWCWHSEARVSGCVQGRPIPLPRAPQDVVFLKLLEVLDQSCPDLLQSCYTLSFFPFGIPLFLLEKFSSALTVSLILTLLPFLGR